MSANILKKLKRELSSMKPKAYNVDLEEVKDFIISCDIPQASKEDLLNNLDSKKSHGINFSNLKTETLKSVAVYNNEVLIIDDVTTNEN